MLLWFEPALLDQARLQLIGNEEQWFFADARQPRLDQLAVVLETQLQAEVVSPDRSSAIRVDAVQRPEVADMLE